MFLLCITDSLPFYFNLINISFNLSYYLNWLFPVVQMWAKRAATNTLGFTGHICSIVLWTNPEKVPQKCVEAQAITKMYRIEFMEIGITMPNIYGVLDLSTHLRQLVWDFRPRTLLPTPGSLLLWALIRRAFYCFFSPLHFYTSGFLKTIFSLVPRPSAPGVIGAIIFPF